MIRVCLEGFIKELFNLFGQQQTMFRMDNAAHAGHQPRHCRHNLKVHMQGSRKTLSGMYSNTVERLPHTVTGCLCEVDADGSLQAMGSHSGIENRAVATANLLRATTNGPALHDAFVVLGRWLKALNLQAVPNRLHACTAHCLTSRQIMGIGTSLQDLRS